MSNPVLYFQENKKMADKNEDCYTQSLNIPKQKCCKVEMNLVLSLFSSNFLTSHNIVVLLVLVMHFLEKDCSCSLKILILSFKAEVKYLVWNNIACNDYL